MSAYSILALCAALILTCLGGICNAIVQRCTSEGEISVTWLPHSWLRYRKSDKKGHTLLGRTWGAWWRSPWHKFQSAMIVLPVTATMIDCLYGTGQPWAVAYHLVLFFTIFQQAYEQWTVRKQFRPNLF